MAHCSDLIPGKVKIVVGDGHIYEPHVVTAIEQCRRFPIAFAELRVKDGVCHKDPADFEFNDLVLIDYQHLDPIKYDFIV